MAASLLQRCLLPVRTAASNLTARRCLLSAAYTDAKVWEQRESDPQNLAELASLMDRSYEKKFPISSLTISRFVDSISSREEVEQAEYYLYKFRHSPNCWYLRDWTVHGWFRQCLKYGARDKALYTLKNKVQFGMFPDEFTFNLLIDSYLKDEDYKGACSVVEEVMLQEAFDHPTTQMLSLYALSKYLAAKPDLSVLIDPSSSGSAICRNLKWQEERNTGAALMLAGMRQKNSAGLSAQLLGHVLLGKVELARGIHAVFHQMPLIWTPGYLGRALAVMESVCSHAGDLKLSKEVLDYLQNVLQELLSTPASKAEEEGNTENESQAPDEEDELERAKLPQYTDKFTELMGRLQAQGKVDSDSLEALVSRLVQEKLGTCEEPDVAQFQKRVQDWEAERRQLVSREKEMREKAQQERLARQAARAAR